MHRDRNSYTNGYYYSYFDAINLKISDDMYMYSVYVLPLPPVPARATVSVCIQAPTSSSPALQRSWAQRCRSTRWVTNVRVKVVDSTWPWFACSVTFANENENGMVSFSCTRTRTNIILRTRMCALVNGDEWSATRAFSPEMRGSNWESLYLVKFKLLLCTLA